MRHFEKNDKIANTLFINQFTSNSITVDFIVIFMKQNKHFYFADAAKFKGISIIKIVIVDICVIWRI